MIEGDEKCIQNVCQKSIFKKRAWTGFTWFKIGPGVRLLETWQ
jgi:hypothetical protein